MHTCQYLNFNPFCALGAIRVIRPFPLLKYSATIPADPRPERFWKYAQSAKLKKYKSNKYAKKGELG
jgi:hypothetical protein